MKARRVSAMSLLVLLTAAVAVAQTAATVRCDAACVQAKVERHLRLMWEFGNEEALQASLKELMALGPPAVRATRDAYNQWSRAQESDARGTEMAGETGARAGEMRWRAVHLLGSLGSREAVPSLYDIARTPLPDPRCKSETFYADEYRVRLRAIAGLENLKAVDELKDLHASEAFCRTRPR